MRSLLIALVVAPLTLSAQSAKNAASVAPTAAPAAVPAPTNARPGLQSWTSDRRDFAVGDIITVLIDDYTITSAVKDDIAAQTRQKDLNLGATVAPPSGPATAISGKVSSKNSGNSQDRGEARRENRFQSEMSVRVVAVGANGTIQVKGARNVNVDKGMQNVELTGWIRAQDVSTANVVESSRIADAKLAYVSPGPLGKAKQGMVSRIISMVWP